MFGRKHSRAQSVCLLAGTNDSEDKTLPVESIFAVSPRTNEEWNINSRQQCKDLETGEYIQYIGDMHCDPIRIYQEISDNESDLSLIATITEDAEMNFVGEGIKSKDSRMLWIGICLAFLTLIFGIVVLARIL